MATSSASQDSSSGSGPARRPHSPSTLSRPVGWHATASLKPAPVRSSAAPLGSVAEGRGTARCVTSCVTTTAHGGGLRRTPPDARTGERNGGERAPRAPGGFGTKRPWVQIPPPRPAKRAGQRPGGHPLPGSGRLDGPPDLLARPLPGPVEGRERVRGARVRRRPQFEEVLDLQAAPAQQPDHVAVTEAEVDGFFVRPLEAVHAELGPPQSLGGRKPALSGD